MPCIDRLANGVVMDDGSRRFDWELRLVDGRPCVVIEADPDHTVCHDTESGLDVTYGRVVLVDRTGADVLRSTFTAR